MPIRDFQAKFGTENGTWVYNVLRGVEFAEVAAKTDVKSMLSSKNFKPSLRTWDEIVSPGSRVRQISCVHGANLSWISISRYTGFGSLLRT